MKETGTDIVFHAAGQQEVLDALQTDAAKGLTEAEARKRLEQYGHNSISENNKRSGLSIFAAQFKSPIVVLLVAAAGLSLVLGEWIDACAILIVLLINAVIGFYMEYQAGRSMDELKKLSTTPARVMRSGQLTEINSDRLVPGDIVFAEAGDVVPADGRILREAQLQADESALTGESVPVEKHTGSLPPDTVLADRDNMLFKGTYISRGNAWLVLVYTGMNTELGRVAGLVQSAKQSATPLEKKLEAFSKKLIKVTVGLVVLIFIAGLLHGQHVLEMLQTAIALAVAAIPEGLPIVATLALARGVIKMARHQVIIKRLSAVETLGSTSVICADKTGTLTKNKIEVAGIYPSAEAAEQLIRRISVLCNTATLYRGGGGLKESGDPLEAGLLRYMQQKGEDPSALRREFPILREEPFSSETKVMATLHKTGRGYVVYAKGAAEELLARCSAVLNSEGERPMDKAEKQAWLKKAETLSASGLKVIALAYKSTENDVQQLGTALVFAGLIGFADPPREDVKEAIAECRTAGIKVTMITGDHPSTALSIARQLGLVAEKETEVMTGKNMPAYSRLQEKEKARWAATRIFARVNPEQKLDIVRVLQEKHFIVAMTGDGINDAPALKKADIGIAMGQRGTQVAREVADMVLKDDRFSSIVHAVKQGRVIFENIRKFVIYLLSCNLSELLVIAVTAVFNMHFRLFPLQILFINLVTDVLPALALGMTGGNNIIMKRPPRHTAEALIDTRRWKAIIFYSVVISAACTGAVWWTHFALHKTETWNPGLCNNILFFTLIFSQLLHVLNMGSGRTFFRSEVFRNKYVWYSLVAGLLIVFAVYLITPFRQALSLYPMSARDWALTLAASLASLLIVRAGRMLRIVRQ